MDASSNLSPITPNQQVQYAVGWMRPLSCAQDINLQTNVRLKYTPATNTHHVVCVRGGGGSRYAHICFLCRNVSSEEKRSSVPARFAKFRRNESVIPNTGLVRTYQVYPILATAQNKMWRIRGAQPTSNASTHCGNNNGWI